MVLVISLVQLISYDNMKDNPVNSIEELRDWNHGNIQKILETMFPEFNCIPLFWLNAVYLYQYSIDNFRNRFNKL